MFVKIECLRRNVNVCKLFINIIGARKYSNKFGIFLAYSYLCPQIYNTQMPMDTPKENEIRYINPLTDYGFKKIFGEEDIMRELGPFPASPRGGVWKLL